MKKYLRMITVLLLLAAMLGGCGRKAPETVQPDDQQQEPEPSAVAEESTFVLCSDGSRTLRFRRDEDGVWQWIDDVSFPLDGQYVDQLIGLTQELEALTPIPQPDPPEYYGLVGAKSYLAIKRVDGTEITYRLGNQAEDGGYYCNSSDDENQIKVAPERIMALMGRSIYDMALLPQLPQMSVKEIKSVTITRGDAADRLTVSRGKWMREKTDVSEDLAVTRLAAALESAAVARCADYAPADGAAEVCGLEPPAATAEIELAKTTLTIRVGSFNSYENAWYVTVGDDTTIYLMAGDLPALLAEWSVGG
jgi:predicted small lipoprotein YifL